MRHGPDLAMYPTREQLRGLSREKASLYGMPHIGCKYTSGNINVTAFDCEYPRCACCGRTNGPHNRHHEPPRSNGSFLLVTPNGQYELMPALIDLCGSGTTGCHGDRHSGKLRIRWEWDCDQSERAWWGGELLSLPHHEPHGEWLYKHGRYVFEHGGKRWEYRGWS